MRIKGLSKPVSICLFLFLSEGILLTGTAADEENTTIIPVNVGVVMDYEFGKMWLSCINMSLLDIYAQNPHYRTRLLLYTRDSKDTVFGAAVAALELLKDVKVEAILGPITSMQATLLTELGDKAQVPIVSFSASAPSLTSINSLYFFQATQNDKTQAQAIGAIIQAFGWRAVVLIYINNEYGVGIIPYLMESLQKIDTHIPDMTAISPSATDSEILEQLFKLISMPTRVFVLHMSPSLGSRLVRKAKQVGMMNEGYVWILTDGMTNFMNSMDDTVIDSMQGVLGVAPYVPKTKELENFRVRWKRKFHQDYPDMVDAELDVYGQWAYDAAKALAIATERAASSTFRVSPVGLEIVRTLVNTSFKGFSGDFRFVNRQLQPSVFQIVNLHGETPKRIGLWVPRKGLVRMLNSTLYAYASSTSAYKASLATIVWPGDSTDTPKGWEFRGNGNKLRIGVPSDSFKEFVNVTIDPITKTPTVTGFCTSIFDAVMRELPYSVEYEYIPFSNPDGRASGTYDDLVYQVYKGNFDAVVGDTTIIANRSLYVDFTLPYIESDVAMLVRNMDDKNNNALMFLRPLSPGLWATTFCFFLFIAFVVWVLEHRINDEFRGSPSHQAGTSLWFAFSTMVFAHRERVMNNLARVVIIVWSFVLLILTQSYTASFSSLLTVDRFHPAITDVHELIQKQEYVGHFNNSFVFGILKGLGFQESYLRAYESAEECDRLLSLGSKNGGIAAAFDESPYMKLILVQNCSNYTLVQPSTFMSKFPRPNIQQLKTGGFGFVFPRGSRLASDVSRAILKVTENIGMQQIEDTWISDESRCPDDHSSVSSSVLGLDSFWGLFLIAGVISFSAVLMYAAMFVYAHREILTSSSSVKGSGSSRVLHLLRTFNQKDPKADASNGFGNPVPVMQTKEQDGTTSEEQENEDRNDQQTDDQLNIEVTNHVNGDPSTQTSGEILVPPDVQHTSPK
ncbi:glutamate receptor 2.7-like [Euphorbia lathyris]|uniref:glutamate receptor 2.7-like n=1 Tax=Euphorbia lathyris TaxID=212925 RepID=UPI0033139ED7